MANTKNTTSKNSSKNTTSNSTSKNSSKDSTKNTRKIPTFTSVIPDEVERRDGPGGE